MIATLRSVRRAFVLQSAALFLVLSMIVPASAATSTSLITALDTANVTRGEFLKALVKSMNIELPKIDRTLPFKDVPTAMLPYVKAANDRKALGIFGTDLQLTKPITRMEAAILVTKLNSFAPSTLSEKPNMRDVVTTDESTAAQVMIEKQLMKPKSVRVFGSKNPLKGREAKLLLDRLSNKTPESEDNVTRVPVVRIRVQDSKLPKSELMDQVWNILSSDYLYQDRLNADKASGEAIKSLVQTLQDPYTVYMPPSQSENFQNQIKGEVEGIGATIEQSGTVLRIVAPIPGSPAEKAGLQPQDEILMVNGKSIQGFTLDEAVNLIRGPKGSIVTLHIRRNGIETDVNVTRDTVRIPEVEITYQGDITVIKILQFGQTTDTQLTDAMREVAAKKPKGIVLDLRNNPGGLLHAAGVVTGYFLPKNSTYASILGRSESYEEKTSENPLIDPSTKLVVLVNKGSASASEIVAGALQDAGRAKLLGQKTFGKGTVQQVVEFMDHSSLKFTVAEWRTPKGRKIDGVGLEPDEVIEAIKGDRDNILLRALDLLR